MQSLLRIVLALSSAGAVLTACADQPTSAPTAPNGPRVTVPSMAGDLNFAGITCDNTQLKADGRATADKSNDVLLTLIGDLPAALRTDGGTPGAASTDKAFDILARIAQIRGTPAQKPDVTGPVFDRLVKGVIRCMKSSVYAGAVEPTQPGAATGFGPALGAGWVFEVRGKNSDPSVGAYERSGVSAETWWGVWPRGILSWAEAIQSTLTQDRVLIYGYRTSSSAFPARLGSSVEHFTIPKVQRAPKAIPPATQLPDPFTLTATIGLCFANAGQIATGARVNHANVFLAKLDAIACDASAPFTPTTGSLAVGRLNPVRLAQRAADFFWPQPLHAAAVFAGGSVTGRPDDFSPSAVWDLSQFRLSDPDTIDDGRTSQALHYKASGNPPVTLNVSIAPGSVAAPDGTPVVLSIVGNSSSIAFFSDSGKAATPTVTRYTQGGVVSYADVKLTKAGGYQVQFQIVFDGVQGGPVKVSNSFNMQNK